MTTGHPFGNLLTQYRARKHGLTQARLARLAGFDPPLITKMCRGKKELAGPSGRERVVRLMNVFRDEGVLSTLDEANALLNAAGMPPLYDGAHDEAMLMRRLKTAMRHEPSVPGTSSSSPSPRTNLPAPVTKFVGRAQQLAELAARVQAKRLLTLVGAGGVGKTRLAIEVGAQANSEAPHFKDGVWLVELAPVTNPAQTAQAILRALSWPEQPDRTCLDVLVASLADKRLLLILDNCEHVIGACAELAERLLSACPELHILATSREALNISGEATWRVPSLATPDPANPSLLKHMGDYEAVELFIDHAIAAQPDFALVAGNAATVARICQRLDGMPLALEMAAAQVSVLSVDEIATGLNDHFGLQMIGRRTALLRHQTLRATLDWSYALLSNAERILLMRLSVFAVGWTGEAAKAVCTGNTLDASDIAPALAQLVHKSLVVAAPHNGQTRYSMLDTIRAYALEKLTDSGELAVMRRQHAEALLAVAQEARPRLFESGQRYWLERLEREHDNMRAALTWCFGPGGDAVLGLCLVASLCIFWAKTHGFGEETLRWKEEALRVPPDIAPPAARAHVLVSGSDPAEAAYVSSVLARYEEGLRLFQSVDDVEGVALALIRVGAMAGFTGDVARGSPLLEEGTALARRIGHRWTTMQGLFHQALLAQMQQDYNGEDALFDEYYTLAQETEDVLGIAVALRGHAYVAGWRLDFKRATALQEEALILSRSVHDWRGEYWSLFWIAMNARYMRDAQRAADVLGELLALARSRGDVAFTGVVLQKLGTTANELGDHRRARDLLSSSLRMNAKTRGADPWAAGDLDGLACVASSVGDARRAAILFGAGDAIRDAIHYPLEPWALLEYAPYIAKARETLGADVYESAWATGHAMTLDQAVGFARVTD